MLIKDQNIYQFLEEKYDEYNRRSFIPSDPISIPHLFNDKEDIEVSGFLVATIAWGQRKTIINNSNRLMELMGNTPFDFVMNHNQKDLDKLASFKHRTFNANDLIFFVKSLHHIYTNHGGLEQVFSLHPNEMDRNISHFKSVFFEIEHENRTQKHISDPIKGSAAKRINMFLRWMVRKDNRGVDFGIWDKLQPNQLYCPLDVHSGNTARKLGLLLRKQNDWKAATELTQTLRQFDPNDPVKYDFSLFGLGVFEKF